MRYVIFGNGRVGTNMAAYLRQLGHDVDIATRSEAETDRDHCRRLIEGADVVAAAIPDGKLPGWRDQWRESLCDKTVIHFSGAAQIEGMHGYHPLYSFPQTLVDTAAMEKIAFACPADGRAFCDVFPGASNPSFVIADHDRAFYHALAVVSGNLSAYLWNQTAPAFEQLSGQAASDIMGVYLQSLVDRFLESPADSLTGPVARRDDETVASNLAALERAPMLRELYEAFLHAAWPNYPR
jgi:hypothetical protein